MPTIDGKDLDQISLADLEALQQSVSDQIDVVRERNLRQAYDQVCALAEGVGKSPVALLEHFGALNKTGKKSATVRHAPKYHNPDNHRQTWSGRGRKPKWVLEHLQDGGDLTELLIKAPI